MTNIFEKASKKTFMQQFQRKLLELLLLKGPLPKPKIALPNLDFHKFFCNKRLLNLKRHLKGDCYMACEENHLSCFIDTCAFER